MLKYFALSYFLYAPYALACGLAAALAVFAFEDGGKALFLQPRPVITSVDGHAYSNSVGPTLAGTFAFFAALVFAGACAPRYDVFVDKCCIDQVDARRKSSGILAIPEVLRRSRSLLVLYESDYFERFWCVFELAIFCSDRRFDAVGAIQLLPVARAPSVFFFFVFFGLVREYLERIRRVDIPRRRGRGGRPRPRRGESGGDGSRRRRGSRRGYLVETTRRGDAAAATRTFCGEMSGCRYVAPGNAFAGVANSLVIVACLALPCHMQLRSLDQKKKILADLRAFKARAALSGVPEAPRRVSVSTQVQARGREVLRRARPRARRAPDRGALADARRPRGLRAPRALRRHLSDHRLERRAVSFVATPRDPGILCEDGSRRRRGRDVDIPRGRGRVGGANPSSDVPATSPRTPRLGHYAESPCLGRSCPRGRVTLASDAPAPRDRRDRGDDPPRAVSSRRPLRAQAVALGKHDGLIRYGDAVVAAWGVLFFGLGMHPRRRRNRLL